MLALHRYAIDIKAISSGYTLHRYFPVLLNQRWSRLDIADLRNVLDLRHALMTRLALNAVDIAVLHPLDHRICEVSFTLCMTLFAAHRRPAFWTAHASRRSSPLVATSMSSDRNNTRNLINLSSSVLKHRQLFLRTS